MASVLYRPTSSLLFELSDKSQGEGTLEIKLGPNYAAPSNINYLSFTCLSFHDDLLLLIIITAITTTTTAMAMITMPTTTPAIMASVEVVVLVPEGTSVEVVTLVPEGGDVASWHSGSLKVEIRTGHVGSISRINPSTTIETSLDIH